MAIDFDALDKQVDFDKLSEDIEKAVEYKKLPNGEYVVRFESIELCETKDGRPMLKAMARVQCACDDDFDIETDNKDAKEFFKSYKGEKKPCVFMNRVLHGTKNDGNMINSAICFLRDLESEVDVKFKSYKQFSECINEVFEEIEESVEYHILYKENDFNTIKIKDAFDI